jgi:hypothetical protein
VVTTTSSKRARAALVETPNLPLPNAESVAVATTDPFTESRSVEPIASASRVTSVLSGSVVTALVANVDSVPF